MDPWLLARNRPLEAVSRPRPQREQGLGQRDARRIEQIRCVFNDLAVTKRC